MEQDALSVALEREHREIDRAIEAYASADGSDTDKAAALTAGLTALRRHIYLEEELLFPPLRDQLVAPIFVMLREHGQMWATMTALEAALSGPSPEAVSAARDELMAQLEAHNAKEEPIIYPQADQGFSAAASDLLREFIATGQTPSGWVCHAARS